MKIQKNGEKSFICFGYRDENYANKMLQIKFWIKFLNQVPDKSNEIGIKVFAVFYKDWIDKCEANKWCFVREEIQNIAEGDLYGAILVFPITTQLQNLRIADFSVNILGNHFYLIT